MHTNIFETLSARGFVSQCTNSKTLSHLLNEKPQTIYLGVDPTYFSLHIGHIVPFYALAHLLHSGHRVILLLGGGTASIGDPSGKTNARKLLNYDEIRHNLERIKEQIQRFFHFAGELFTIKDNMEWLSSLQYLDFLRTVGRHFSVNRMLTFDTYKTRLKTGLSFLEFNYQLLQSYDFYQLYKQFNCTVQIGGDDQWGNIVAGIDLIRRMEKAECYGITCPLITMSNGQKMGKSEDGSVFLASELTSSYQFFQYWRNICDQDVEKFLLLFTFLPIEECHQLGRVEGVLINKSKERLAYEITKLIHGELEADKALSATHALFKGSGTLENAPQVILKEKDMTDGIISIIDLFIYSALFQHKSEVKRMIKQGGAYYNDQKILDEKMTFSKSNFEKNGIILRIGKTKHVHVIFQDYTQTDVS